jgi:hypothetical protein
MAKQKTAKVPELKCSICQVPVTAETYAAHIQEKHTTQQQMTTHSMAAAMPPWNPGGSGGITPISGPISGKDLSASKYLKGEDVPQGVSEVRFKLVQFVRDPAGRSKLAAQIEQTYGKILFGFNTTNIRACVALGIDDMQALVGKTIVCMLGMAPNPQKNGQPTKALFVSRVE